MLEQAPNYFGIFQAGYYLRELALLQWSMLASLQGLDSPPSRQRQRPLGDATSMVEEPAARAFWTKCFGREVDVAWPRFRDAFVAEFGKHPDEALTRFMEVRCEGRPRRLSTGGRPSHTPPPSPPLPIYLCWPLALALPSIAAMLLEAQARGAFLCLIDNTHDRLSVATPEGGLQWIATAV